MNAHLVSTQRTVEMFLSSLAEHVGEPWTLEEMAGRCGLGRTSFTRYCQRLTNLSPHNYLTHCRIEAAKRLLKAQPRLSVLQVAMECGFQSSQYFATVFAQATTQTPNEFREAKT